MRGMKAFKTVYNFLDQLGRWSMPKTPEEKRAADITTIILMALAAVLFILSLRS